MNACFRAASAALLLATIGVFSAPVAWAGPERVDFPAGYGSDFVRYQTVDKPKRKTVRFLYVNESALAAATDEGLPSGMVIVMEDHKAVLGTDGTPVTDATGRFVPEPGITNIFVMEKRDGWGTAYAEDVRNGDWDYAWFVADGSRKPDAKFTGCLACHQAQADADYTFTTLDFVRVIK
jgi:hypothetical protein